MLLTLFIIPLISLLFISLSWNLKTINYNLNNVKLGRWLNKFVSLLTIGRLAFSLVKIVTLWSLFINLFYSLYLWKFFPAFILNKIYYPSSIIIGKVTVFEAQHVLSLPFVILSSFILIIALLTSWYSESNMLLLCSMLLLIELFLIGAFTCSSIFVFLLFFEASALPIFILISYCGSGRRERIKAGYYFLFFTVYGSLSLLLLIINFYSLSQITFFMEQSLQSNNHVLWLLIFIAFAVKIPLFPFHIWLPYAHVEASTSTSIILAALMLKLGGYGVLKFMLPLFTMETHLFFRPFAITICILGTIYGGFAAIRQIDMKRQIAFSSISHMSFATLGIFTFTNIGIKGSIYLMLSHGLTSAALFYLVGVLSDRYHTRSIMAFSGLLSTMPLFSFFLIFISLANVGFPGTSGFLPEFFILVAVVSSVPAVLIPVLIGMLLTTASSLVLLLRVLFGSAKSIYSTSYWLDVTKLECFVLFLLSSWILVFGLYDLLFFI